jgi:hypothetical protein
MTQKTIYLFFLLLSANMNLWGQTELDIIKPADTLGLSMADSTFRFFPLIRDATGKFPKQLFVTGKIVDISTGTSCGVVCGCGTIKVKLSNTLKGYSASYVFIAIPCFSVNSKDFLNKTIKIQTDLLRIDNKDCFWNELPVNYIDSKGVPFYIPSNLDKKINVE